MSLSSCFKESLSDLGHQSLKVSLGNLLEGLLSNFTRILYPLKETVIIENNEGNICIEITELLPSDDLSISMSNLNSCTPLIELFVSKSLLSLCDSAALCLWLSSDLAKSLLGNIKATILERKSHHFNESFVVDQAVCWLVSV